MYLELHQQVILEIQLDEETHEQSTYFKIEKALNMVNTRLTNIVRCRLFITNIDNLKSIGKAHSEFYSELKPATMRVEIKRLVRPEMIVELEVDALTY